MIDDPIHDVLVRERQPPVRSRQPDRDAEYRVLAMLEGHGAREGAALAAYRDVAEADDVDPGIRYLTRLILEDEERHHRVFTEMANQIKSFVWEVDVEPQAPSMVPRADADLLGRARRLLEFEHEDAKELRQLRKAVEHSPRSSLHPLLVELMLHDTEKHIAILEHICRRLRRR